MSNVKIALIGNPNCGKTTMFNELTGSNQYVGNWPGVTVEKKEGKLKGSDAIVTDLPGIYSLSPYTLEEVVSRNYLLEGGVGAVLNLVDASNIERNLYLTTQVLEIGYPVAIALNMMDIVRAKGDKIDTQKLSAALGVEIVECSALKGEGLEEAAAKAVALAKSKAMAPKPVIYKASVENALKEIEGLMGNKLPVAHRRWALVKLFERDSEVMEALSLTAAEKSALDKIIAVVEKAEDDDSEAIIANARYEYIGELMQEAVVKASVGVNISEKIDRIVTHKLFALPIFAMIMFMVYYIAIETIGTALTDYVNDDIFADGLQPYVQELLEGAECEDWLVSLVVDGIIGGIGAPLGFVPQMAVVFLLLAFLEDCGYMARIAFIMDRIFRQFGLSGKSFIPMLISSGCGVPGLMASRTIKSEKERRITLMTTTFIPCSAKLPVIALIAGAIMGGEWYFAPIMYFIGFASVIICSLILKKSEIFEGDASPFIMELPPYHMPTVYNLLLHTWDRTKHFLIKAGTIIFLCCLFMWFMASFGFGEEGFGMVEETEQSMLAVLGGALAPIFAPLGFGTWQAVGAAISGFVAKESIVSTIAIVAGLGEEIAETEDEQEMAKLWVATMKMFPSVSAAFSFLVFNLMNSPCLAAITTMAKELESKKMATYAIIFQNAYAYALAMMFYQLGSYFVEGKPFTVGTAAGLAVFAGLLFLMLRPKAKVKALKVAMDAEK